VLDVRAASDGLVNTTIRFADGSGASVELPAPAEQVGARIVIRCRREPFDGPRNPGEPSPRDLAAERGLAWRRKRPLRAVLTANRLSCLASARRAPEVWPLRR
jgi:hypothetical protein